MIPLGVAKATDVGTSVHVLYASVLHYVNVATIMTLYDVEHNKEPKLHKQPAGVHREILETEPCLAFVAVVTTQAVTILRTVLRTTPMTAKPLMVMLFIAATM